MLSGSWNRKWGWRFGTAFGAEAAANHVVGLYAPGMNIHRTAGHAPRLPQHPLHPGKNSIAIAAAVDNTPYWFILLAIVDSILLIAIVLLILKRIPAGKKRERSPNAPHLIKTHIGVGYRMLRAENDKV